MEKIKEGLYAGKYKIVENVLVDTNTIQAITENLTEAEKMVKTQEGEKVKCIAAYRFPISRPDKKNLNERIYTKTLWEKAIKENQGVGSYGLIDHPEDDGSFHDAWCVWRKFSLGESAKKKEGKKDSLVFADAYLFGDLGKKVKEAIDAGGKVGLSTVAYGDFKEDGITIDEEGFVLDQGHACDFVLNPSYEVFGESEHIMFDNTVDEVAESVEDDDDSKELMESVENEPLEDGDTIKEDNTPSEGNLEVNKEDNNMQDKKTNSFEEKAFRMNISQMIKAVENDDTTLKEKRKAYSDLLFYFDESNLPDLELTVKEKISDIDEKLEELVTKGAESDSVKQSLEEQISTLETSKTELEEEVKSLSEKYEAATELADSLRTNLEKVKELYEVQRAKVNSMVDPEEYNELTSYVETLEAEIAEMKEKLVEYRKSLRDLQKEAGKKKKRMDQEDPEDDEDEDDDEDDDNGDDVEEYGKKKKKDSAAPKTSIDENGVNPDVLDYYYEMEEAYPGMVKIKENILRCKTLMEAQRTYLNLKSIVFDTDTGYHTPKVSKGSSYRESNKDANFKIPQGWK